MRSTAGRSGVAEEAGPPIAADSEVVALDGVSISYAHRGKPDVEAVRDFSLRVNRGEVMSLVGPSGCGKTSLLRAIAGLRALTGGRIEIRTAAGQAPFAVVFQQPSLLPWRTAIQNAAYGIECMTKDRKLTRSRAAGALAMVGLAGYENYYPNQLSGGMQQRVNLARALAVQPAVLLLDEPFSSLDAQLRERMQTEFLGVIEETNATALFITHQVDEAVYLSDRVAVMSSEPGMLRSVLTVDLAKRRDARDRRGGDFMELCDAVAATLAGSAGSEDLA